MAKYRKLDQGGGLFSGTEHQQAVARREVGILKLRDVIDWEKLPPKNLACHILLGRCGWGGKRNASRSIPFTTPSHGRPAKPAQNSSSAFRVADHSGGLKIRGPEEEPLRNQWFARNSTCFLLSEKVRRSWRRRYRGLNGRNVLRERLWRAPPTCAFRRGASSVAAVCDCRTFSGLAGCVHCDVPLAG